MKPILTLLLLSSLAMAESYVLLVSTTFYGKYPAYAVLEFKNRKACKLAAKEITKQRLQKRGLTHTTICVKKE